MLDLRLRGSGFESLGCVLEQDTFILAEYLHKIVDRDVKNQIKQDKFDEFISPDEGLFERNM